MNNGPTEIKRNKDAVLTATGIFGLEGKEIYVR
jgi:hypothetical protein